MRIESDDEVYRTLCNYSWTDGECVKLPELRQERWVKVNNALVSRGAVRRKDGGYYFHEGGLACLIIAARFAPRRKAPPRKAVKFQHSLFQAIYERLGLNVPMIRIVGVRVGEPAKVEEIGDDLRSFQAFVGGDMELHGLGNDIAVVCNEDGLRLGLPQNGCGLLGPWFFTKNDGQGDQMSLSDAEVEACLTYWATYRAVRHSGSGRMEVTTYDSLDAMLADQERKRREANEAN